MAIGTNTALDAEREHLRTLRRNIAVGLQAMHDLLDMLDGDPDLEDGGGAEPSLGWPEASRGSTLNIGSAEDGEEGDDHGVADADGWTEQRGLEPSLGSIGSCVYAMDQTDWASGGSQDAEQDDGDEGEPDEGDEPSLGSTHSVDQERAWKATRHAWSPDLEFDGDDRPDPDKEPSLGSLDRHGGQMWWGTDIMGSRDDREHEHDGREEDFRRFPRA